MSASELAEWQAYERIEGPLGDSRGDLQAAAISYWGLQPYLGSDSGDVSLTDLMIKFDEPTPTEPTDKEVDGPYV